MTHMHHRCTLQSCISCSSTAQHSTLIHMGHVPHASCLTHKRCCKLDYATQVLIATLNALAFFPHIYKYFILFSYVLLLTRQVPLAPNYSPTTLKTGIVQPTVGKLNFHFAQHFYSTSWRAKKVCLP